MTTSRPSLGDFPSIYAQYRPLVFQFIHVLGGAGDIPEDDIVQDIFLKLWENKDQLSQICSIRDYLFLMVKNRLINEWQRVGIRRKAMTQLGETWQHSGTTTDEEIRYRAFHRSWQEGIRRLPAKTRKAYELKENACYKNEAIAQELGISASMAKQHIQIAVKRLKAHLDAHGHY